MANLAAAPVSMLKLVTGMQTKQGFTLIEILVVILIIGITLGFALLAFGDFGANRRIIVAAEQFVGYVKLVQQQAILETSTLGINFNKNGYQVMRFQTPASWQAMPQKSIFHTQYFPDSTVINLESNSKKSGNPQIIINSSGDMTAFTLHLGSAHQVDLATVVGTFDGNVSLQLAK